MNAVDPHRLSMNAAPGKAVTTCPVCSSTPRYLYTIERFSPAFDVHRCAACGLEMQPLIPEQPGELYDEAYYTGAAEYNYRDERRKTRYDRYVHNARLRNIARFVPAPADFTDVGAAFGSFVEAARDFGYRARGLDVSAYAAAEARKRGLDVTHGELEPGVLAPRSTDVLTMIEVFEHLPDPRRAMQALREAVRPGGLVVVQTANFLGRQARIAGAGYHYYLPGHFFYYNTRNLRRLFAEFGFSRSFVYRPVDFGLVPKLLKSRGDFTKAGDYLRWLKIVWYHLKGKVAFGDFALTSSMVFYAVRDSE